MSRFALSSVAGSRVRWRPHHFRSPTWGRHNHRLTEPGKPPLATLRRTRGAHPAVPPTDAVAETQPSQWGGGDPSVELLFGAVSPVAKPGSGGVRKVRSQIVELPVFRRGEGGVAERVGHAPTDFNEVVEAQLMRHRVIVVSKDGRGKLVREIPVQGEIGAGRAVIDRSEEHTSEL